MSELSEEEFKKLERPSHDLELDKDTYRSNLLTAYRNIIDLLKEYVDVDEKYYNIIALWIIGTYFHSEFPSYPFLFFNAMKGSGKSRVMNLITHLSKDGEKCMAMTEAVLFRTTGTLAIDEFEGVTRKGGETLRELLNASYKKGTKVKRMAQKKTLEGTTQVVEEFDIFRPILLANIWGMESVLSDRCITIILEKSSKKQVTNLVELFDQDPMVLETRKLLEECSKCRCRCFLEDYRAWNKFIYIIYTNTLTTLSTLTTQNQNLPLEAFKTINSMDLNGREVELSLPLCLVANEIDPENLEILKLSTLTLKEIFQDKKEEEKDSNIDVSLYDFVATDPMFANKKYLSLSDITQNFKDFIGVYEKEMDSRWMARGLKRLNLIIEKKRVGKGTSVLINQEKAIKQMEMFR